MILTVLQQLTTMIMLVPQHMPMDNSVQLSTSCDTIIVRTTPAGEQASDNKDSAKIHHHVHDNQEEVHSDHSGRRIHMMPMVGVGAPGEAADFFSIGLMAEYQFSALDWRMGVGLMGMVMNFTDETHFMLLVTGSAYVDKHWSILLEVGSTHGQNRTGMKHEMSPMIGIGAGRHCLLGGISIVPMLIGEYSRLQRPTYSFSLGLVLF